MSENQTNLGTSSENNRVVSIRKDSLWKYSTFILLAFIIVGGFVFFSQNRANTTGNVANTQTQGQQLPSQQQRVEIPITSQDPQIGKADAPVKVIEFSDFSCPFCAAASGQDPQISESMKKRDPTWEPAVPGILNDYVKAGKVLLVYKFAFGHSGGHPASLVGWCLNDQGLFWKFYDLAFAHQLDTEDLTKMKDLAKQVGADMGKLNSCLDSKKYDFKFDADTKAGHEAGVQGTPTFFVNGKPIVGAASYSQFKQAIDAELASA